MAEEKWVDVGPAEELRKRPITPVKAGGTPVALVHRDGVFTAISGVCNHVGGPLGDGRLDGDYVVCPWHNWKFHHRDRRGRARLRGGPRPELRRQGRGRAGSGRRRASARRATRRRTRRTRSRAPCAREPGPVRVAGISTTVMDRANPRYSTSEALLAHALAHARTDARRRDAADPPRRAQLPRLRGLLLEERHVPAPGPARSRRWTRTTSSTGSTRRSCTGPT